MLNLLIALLQLSIGISIFILVRFLYKKILFKHMPKKFLWIYDEIFATRGIITSSQPNTKKAIDDVQTTSYKKGDLTYKFGIVLNVRMTKDKIFVCFRDKYLKKLTGIPGRLQDKTYDEVKDYRIFDDDKKINRQNKIISFKEALTLINNGTIILDINNYMSKNNVYRLQELMSTYQGVIIISCGNLFTYLRLVKCNVCVMWKFNIFRKRINVVRDNVYKNRTLPTYDEIVSHLNKYPELSELNLPTAEDLVFTVVDSTDVIQSIVRSVWNVSNRYNTRIDKNNFLLTTKIAHRGIYSTKYAENSVEAIEECCSNDVPIEIDFFWYKYVRLDQIVLCIKEFVKSKNKFSQLYSLYSVIRDFLLGKGEVRVGHQGDNMSRLFGQQDSLVGRIKDEESLSIDDFLAQVNARVPIVLDVKDFSVFSRKLIKAITNSLSEYNGQYVIQSFNPLLLRWLYKNQPGIIRGQVGHSLKGLRDKIPNWLFWAINFCLFHSGKPDYIVYDLDSNVHILSRYNNILGLPVLGYAPSRYTDILPFLGYFQNYICENLANKNAWQETAA